MNVEDHAFRDATDEKDRIIVDIRARLAAALAENSDLRALLTEARSHNPEKYRSSSDDSGTHGAELGGVLLPSPSSDSTRVAPSGEGSGQPMIREGWCPHCGITRIEDYSGVARNGDESEADMNYDTPMAAAEKAAALLAFRERYAPDNPRFHERWLLMDNGERGSGQKTMDFSADDLAALVADLTALRQRHAEANTCVVCSATLLPFTEPPHCEDCHPTEEDDAKWRESAAKARLT